MPSFYDDNDDLRFYIERAVDWEPLVRLTEVDLKAPGAPASIAEAADTYRQLLELVGTFAAEEIAPHWRALDQAHPKVEAGEVVSPPVVDRIFAQVRELGLHGLCVPRELGGLNAPLLVYMATIELFSRADVSVAAHHSFHGGMAMAALMYSVLEGTTTFDTTQNIIAGTRFRAVVDEIVAGAAWGSMDITEPGAGSDMAALRTRGELASDGAWAVTGQKIFITSGHAKYHFVIARTEPGDGGLDALSMFLVPSWEDLPDGTRRRLTTIDGVEEKLGHNASATVSISFDHTRAWLIGRRGEGFRNMLLLMNNARVGVAFECIGLMEAAYRRALAYARERPSMGKTIDRHEMIADMLEEMHTDLQAIRCLAIAAAVHEETAQKLRLRLIAWPPEGEAARASLEADRARHAAASRRLTPLLKWVASERAVHHARRAVQIHGGAGYICESGVEKLLRDAMVFPIYEGTSQIQALMAMKDTLLDAVKHPDAFVRRQALARWRALSAGDPRERRVAKLQVVRGSAIQFLLSRLAGNKVRELGHHGPKEWRSVLTTFDPKRDFALAMLHAERLCELLAEVALAEELWKVAQRFPERAELIDRHLERAELRCRHLAHVITTTGPRLLATLEPSAPAGSTPTAPAGSTPTTSPMAAAK